MHLNIISMTRNTPLFWLGVIVSVVGFVIVITANLPFLNELMVLPLSLDFSAKSDINNNGWLLIQAFESMSGAIMVGWGFSLMAMADHYTEKTRQYLGIGLISWFILDSTASILNKLQLNVVINLVFLSLGLWVFFQPIKEESETTQP